MVKQMEKIEKWFVTMWILYGLFTVGIVIFVLWCVFKVLQYLGVI